MWTSLKQAFERATAKDLKSLNRLLDETETLDQYGDSNRDSLRQRFDLVFILRVLSYLLTRENEEFRTTTDEISKSIMVPDEKKDIEWQVRRFLDYAQKRNFLTVRWGSPPHPLRPELTPVEIHLGILTTKWGFERKEASHEEVSDD